LPRRENKEVAETYPCPVEGCDHTPFKMPQALGSHIHSVHLEVPGEQGSVREVPIVDDDFATLLKRFKIKADLAANITGIYRILAVRKSSKNLKNSSSVWLPGVAVSS